MVRRLETWIAEHGGGGYVYDRIAAGESIRQIAERIVLPGAAEHISRPMLYRWRNRDPERRRLWAEAMADSSHALAEDAGDVLEQVSADPTSAQVSKAKGIAEHKRWLAAKRNRDDYGDGPQTQINVLTAGDLHLDALRRHGHMDRHELTGADEAAREALPEAEVLEEESAV